MLPPTSSFLLLLMLLTSSSLALPSHAGGGLSKRFNWVLVSNRLRQPQTGQAQQPVRPRLELQQLQQQQLQQLQQQQQRTGADLEDSLTQFYRMLNIL